MVLPIIVSLVKANKRLFGGVVALAGGTVAYQLSNMVGTALAARILAKGPFGELMLFFGLITTFGIIAGTGIGNVVTKNIAEYRNDQVKLKSANAACAATIAVTSILMLLGAFFFRDSLSALLLHDSSKASYVLIAGIAAVASAIDNYNKSYLAGLEDWTTIRTVLFLDAVLVVPAIYLGARFGGLEGALIALAVAFVAQMVISQRSVFSRTGQSGLFELTYLDKHSVAVIVHQALPAAIAGIVVVPAHWVAQVLISAMPGGFEHVAVLGVGLQWFNMITFLPGLTGRVLLPILSSQINVSGTMGAKKHVLLTAFGNALVCGVIAFSIYLALPVLLSAYRFDALAEKGTVGLFLLSAVLASAAVPVGQFIISAGGFWIAATLNVLWAAAYLGLTFKTRQGGALAVAQALLWAYSMHCAFSALLLFGKTGRRRIQSNKTKTTGAVS